MFKHFYILFCYVVLLFSMLFSPLTQAVPDFEQLDKSVVLIVNKQHAGVATGTGFVINEQGYVVTNNHVIEGGGELFVVDGGEQITRENLRSARLKWSSATKDLAVLQVNGLNRPYLKLSGFELVKGSRIHAIGFPGAASSTLNTDDVAESTVSGGEASRIVDGHWSDNSQVLQIVQHTAALNGGNSGGPLLNNCGAVVGVNTMKSMQSESGEIIQGLFYASYISELVSSLSAQNFIFHETSESCKLSSTVTGDNPNAAQSGVSLWITGLAILMALFALVLTLRRPRQQIVQTVESYSHWLRRSEVKKAKEPDYSVPSVPEHSVLKPSKKEPILVLSGFDANGQAVHLRLPGEQLKVGIMIGRSAKLVDMVVRDSSVSRRHVKIYLKASALMLEDVNSSNGTQVNTKTISPFKAVSMNMGDKVKLGGVELTLSAE